MISSLNRYLIILDLLKKATKTNLWSFHRYNSIQLPGRVIEKRNGDSSSGSGNPRPFGLRIDVEDVRFARKDGLFPVDETKIKY